MRATLSVEMVAVIDNLLAEARRRSALPPAPIRRLLREQAGLTQAEVASALGVGRPAVTRWESGMRCPRGDVRIAYIELLERLAEEHDG